MNVQRQQPFAWRPPKDLQQALRVVAHPAVRLGFLDAQAGNPLNHDRIMERIERETPHNALMRLGWYARISPVDLAQYRYEEGRQMVKEYGLRCKSWSAPDYPPKQVRDFLAKQVAS